MTEIVSLLNGFCPSVRKATTHSRYLISFCNFTFVLTHLVFFFFILPVNLQAYIWHSRFIGSCFTVSHTVSKSVVAILEHFGLPSADASSPDTHHVLAFLTAFFMRLKPLSTLKFGLGPASSSLIGIYRYSKCVTSHHVNFEFSALRAQGRVEG